MEIISLCILIYCEGKAPTFVYFPVYAQVILFNDG
jgi:hypothetical protein